MFSQSKFFCIGTFLLSTSLLFSKPLELVSGYNTFTTALVKNLKENFHLNSLIETGTLSGMTSARVSHLFDEVHTIELSEELFKMSKENTSTYPNITCYHGDSSKDLLAMIQKAPGIKVFWLDAHFSGGTTAESVVGDPIIYELNQIIQSRQANSVVLVDDIRGHDIPIIKKTLSAAWDTFKYISLGDIFLAYDSRYHSPEVSDFVSSYTLSRYSNNLSEAISGDLYILTHHDSQREHLKKLYIDFGGVYGYWNGLLELSNKNYRKAISSFIESKEKGLNYFTWRIDAYLLFAHHKIQQAEEALKAFDKLSPYIDNYKAEITRIVGEEVINQYTS